MVGKNFIYVALLFIFISCDGNNSSISPILEEESTNPPENTTPPENNQNNPPQGNSSNDWLVPIAEVKDGGPGKDGIPSIDNPVFVAASSSEASYLKDEDLVVGVVMGNEIRAYPHLVLDWHEIVNDQYNDEYVTISYCPLTGTAFGWLSISGGSKSTFGVSGLLYNANLILYDRKTDSNWSQLGLKCINGNQIGDEPNLVKIVETSWFSWKTMYPSTKVLSLETGFSRNYGFYPYGAYKTNHDFFIFTASPQNSALPNKERVHAIIDGEDSKVYQFENFRNGNAIRQFFKGKEYLVVGNENIICSFELNENQSGLNFEYAFNNSEVIFKDDEGNKWNIFGEAIEGPRSGELLKASKSVVSYWFAIAAFYPNPALYRE